MPPDCAPPSFLITDLVDDTTTICVMQAECGDGQFEVVNGYRIDDETGMVIKDYYCVDVGNRRINLDTSSPETCVSAGGYYDDTTQKCIQVQTDPNGVTSSTQTDCDAKGFVFHYDPDSDSCIKLSQGICPVSYQVQVGESTCRDIYSGVDYPVGGGTDVQEDDPSPNTDPDTSSDLELGLGIVAIGLGILLFRYLS